MALPDRDPRICKYFLDKRLVDKNKTQPKVHITTAIRLSEAYEWLANRRGGVGGQEGQEGHQQ